MPRKARFKDYCYGNPFPLYDRYLYVFFEPPGCLLTPYHSGMCAPQKKNFWRKRNFISGPYLNVPLDSDNTCYDPDDSCDESYSSQEIVRQSNHDLIEESATGAVSNDQLSLAWIAPSNKSSRNSPSIPSIVANHAKRTPSASPPLKGRPKKDGMAWKYFYPIEPAKKAVLNVTGVTYSRQI